MGSFKKLAVFFVIFLGLSVNSPAAMADSASAKQFVQSMGDKVIAIVTDKKLNDSKKEEKLKELFVKTVDIKWIAKFVVGRYWREYSKEQHDSYIKEYSKFLINSYVPKFKQYTNQKINFGKSISEGDSEYTVETTIIDDNDGKTYRVNYKLKEDSNGFRLYDIVAEGISMITTQRSEYGSILSREGLESLTAKLKQRN